MNEPDEVAKNFRINSVYKNEKIIPNKSLWY